MTAIEARAWSPPTSRRGRGRRWARCVDPELDEPITDLGFVPRATGWTTVDVEVHLRLPTSFCSPSFAYLMVGRRVRRPVRSCPGSGGSSCSWTTTSTRTEINAGVAAGAGFVGHLRPDEADESLDDLRLIFQRKAHTAGDGAGAVTGWSGRRLDVAELHGLRLADLRPTPETDALLRRRRGLGLPSTADAPVLVDDDGRPCPGRPGADAPAVRPHGADLDRRQRALLPRSAARPATTTPRPTSNRAPTIPICCSPIRPVDREDVLT